jgi:membrane associated rhomboid family serine protease
MPQPDFLPPPPSGVTPEYCYRHPAVQTGVHCTRCERSICPDCMVSAPVGYQCPDCANRSKREFAKGGTRRAVTVGARRTTASVTNVLIALTAAMFLVELALGGPNSLLAGPSVSVLARIGGAFAINSGGNGIVRGGIAMGQYWRLVSPMFLHAGIIHIAMNMYGLWLFGRILEDEMGSVRMLVIYFLSGIAGNAASFAFGPNTVSIGASGAIYGLLGAFVAYNYQRRHLRFFRARLQAVMPWVVLNFVLSFSIPFIDWRAHLGGFVAGILAAYATEGVRSRDRGRMAGSLLGVAGLVAVIVGIVAFGRSHWLG